MKLAKDLLVACYLVLMVWIIIGLLLIFSVSCTNRGYSSKEWPTQYKRCYTNEEQQSGMCWQILCSDEETPIPPGFEQAPKREAEGRFCVWKRRW